MSPIHVDKWVNWATTDWILEWKLWTSCQSKFWALSKVLETVQIVIPIYIVPYDGTHSLTLPWIPWWLCSTPPLLFYIKATPIPTLYNILSLWHASRCLGGIYVPYSICFSRALIPWKSFYFRGTCRLLHSSLISTAYTIWETAPFN